MKKSIFLFMAFALLSLTAARAQQANIFASELKASAVSADNDVEFTYTLNADAKALSIKVSNGETFEVTSVGDLTKGSHTVTKRLTLPTAVGNYTWSITAEGSPNYAAEPVKVSDDAAHLGFHALRGLVVDNSFESPFFGRIYATEGNEDVVAAGIRATNDGVYIYNAALQDVTNQGDNAYTGGVIWGLSGSANSGASPFRVSTAPDGRVFVADWSDTHSGIWLLDPANPSADLKPVFAGTRDTRGVVSTSGIGTHGSVSHCYIEGVGANTKLYTFDEDLGLSSGVSGNIYRYDIGNLDAPWTAAPSELIYNDAANGNLQQNGNSCISPDGRGGWWISQYRSEDINPAIPSLIHYNGTSVDFVSAADAAGVLVSSHQGGMALNEDKSLIALSSSGNVKIFDITFDGTGKPTIALKYKIDTPFGDFTFSVALDKADNIYVGGNAKAFEVFALPKDDNSFTTPAPKSQPVSVTQEITGLRTVVAGDVRIVCKGDQITIISGSPVQSVKFFDLQGRTIAAKQGIAASDCSIPAPEKGIYIVETMTEGVRNVQKIVVH